MYGEHVHLMDKLNKQQSDEKEKARGVVTDEIMVDLNATIKNSIKICGSASVRIILMFYLCIDYSQKDMIRMSLSDFDRTTSDITLKDNNYLNIDTGEWSVEGKKFVICKEFIDYVKLQHGKPTATNFKRLIGQKNTFEKYGPQTGTTAYSNVFSDTLKMSYAHFKDMFESHYEYKLRPKKEIVEADIALPKTIATETKIKLKFKEKKMK